MARRGSRARRSAPSPVPAIGRPTPPAPADAAVPDSPAHERAPRRVPVRTIALVLGPLLLLGGGVLLFGYWSERALTTRVPPPPRSAAVTPAVRAHLEARYAAALQTPRSADAVGAYCLALHADMLYDEAARCYAVPIELADGDWRWTYYRALIRADLGGGRELVDDLRSVVQAAPEFAPAWLRLGDARFKRGEYDDADASWTKAAALPEPPRDEGADGPPHVTEVPLAAYASLGLARIRLMRREVDAAEAIVTRVMDDGPPFSSAYRLLAEIRTVQGRDAEAQRALARARRLSAFAPPADPMVDVLARESRNSTFLLRMASEANLATNGLWSEYLTRRALEFDPDNPEVVTKLARVLRTIGRTEEALTYFRRYQQMVPGDVQVLAHIGSSLSELGRFAEAEPYLRRAAGALDDGLTHYNLGLLLARTGRLGEAVASYERALERDPDDVTARSNLAATLVRQGHLDRAAQELRRVLAIDPENAIAHTNLGLLHAQRGDLDRARQSLREALRVDPAFTPAADALRDLAG